jgi:hypothetical protein
VKFHSYSIWRCLGLFCTLFYVAVLTAALVECKIRDVRMSAYDMLGWIREETVTAF